eukprot:EG_transcript_34607
MRFCWSLIVVALAFFDGTGGAAVLTVVPDTIEPGARAAYWNLTAADIAAVAPQALQYIYVSACCSKTLFIAQSSSSTPFGIVGGCATNYTATYNTMLIYLPNNCGLSAGTLSFLIPGSLLAVNPGGNISVVFTIGSNNLNAVIPYPPDSPSPSRSPSLSPASRSPSPNPSPSRSPSPSP